MKKIVLVLILFTCLMVVSHVSAGENSTDGLKDSSLSADEPLKSVTLKTAKLSTTYGSGKYFKVKAVDAKSKKPVSKLKVNLKVFTGKKYKKTTITTDSNGIAKYSASKLKIGKHKVIVSSKQYGAKSKISYIKVLKAKLTVKAPKVKNIFKQKGAFQITVKNKESKKPMKAVKVTLKVFTGKKYKKYFLKTNKKGMVSINTKYLSKGTHKVTVTVKATSKLKSASAKSSIKIISPSKYIKLKVNGHVLSVKLVNNAATKALLEKLKKGDITIYAEEYGGFEKVGGLGYSLPTSDVRITTAAGDIVLYSGDEISVNYGSNTWEYTRLGKIQNIAAGELKNILGTGNVKLVFSLK